MLDPLGLECFANFQLRIPCLGQQAQSTFEWANLFMDDPALSI
jgi:hypothetical protein